MIRGYKAISEIDPQHSQMHEQLFRFGLGIIDKKFTAVPTTKEVPPGYCAAYQSGSTRRLYFNFYGTMTYFALTAA